jgi:hypothetical protein
MSTPEGKNPSGGLREADVKPQSVAARGGTIVSTTERESAAAARGIAKTNGVIVRIEAKAQDTWRPKKFEERTKRAKQQTPLI